MLENCVRDGLLLVSDGLLLVSDGLLLLNEGEELPVGNGVTLSG